MIYKDSNNNYYRFLAYGIDKTNGQNKPCVIYCPNNNEHSIFVLDEQEFFNQFTEDE